MPDRRIEKLRKRSRERFEGDPDTVTIDRDEDEYVRALYANPPEPEAEAGDEE